MSNDWTVLVFAPVGRDAELTLHFLHRASIAARACVSVSDLCSAFEEQGAGAILLTEESLEVEGFGLLIDALERQPPWSDVPILLFGGQPDMEMPLRTIRALETLRNVTLLERPIRLAAVLSSVRAALRSRRRQYEVRDLLVELHRARSEAESTNRLKDEFLATLSHELRTPLNAIIGWTSLLTRGQVDPERMPRVFEALDRNAQSQAQLIADVLDVSRIISDKLQLQLTTVDISDVAGRAADSVRPAAVAKGIALEVRDAPRCLVRGDPDRLQQVIWNLVANAVKFTTAGGRITIDVSRRENVVEVSVRDTGAGIAPEFLPYVFERFRQADQTRTRSHGGLGLGLAIVRHLTELHGGKVTAASDGEGRGATFQVTLPANDEVPALASPIEPADRMEVSLAGRTIMVIDDDPSTREVMAAMLDRTQANVILAGSAAEARAAIDHKVPDLIITDLGMPGEDGFSLLNSLRQAGAPARHVPAIALSAYADARSQESALAAGFTTFVAKPVRPQALLEITAKLLALA